MDGIEEQLEKLILYLRSYRALIRDPKMLPPGLQSRDELESEIKELFVNLMGYGASLREREEEETRKIDERLKYLLNERIGEKTMEESSRLIKEEISHLRRVIRGLPKINPGEREIKANLRMLGSEIKNLKRKPAIVNLEESETMKEIFRLRKQLANLGKEDEEDIYAVFPPTSDKKEVGIGTVVIDFLTGDVALPDGTTEHTNYRLENTVFEAMRSLSVDTTKAIVIELDDGTKFTVEANQFYSIPNRKFRIAYIHCTETTKLRVYASTSEDSAIRFETNVQNTDEQRYTQLIEYSGGNPEYIGEGLPGVSEDSAEWRIKKIEYSGSNPSSVKWAGGTEKFINKWSEKGDYSYS